MDWRNEFHILLCICAEIISIEFICGEKTVNFTERNRAPLLHQITLIKIVVELLHLITHKIILNKFHCFKC